MKKKLFFLPLVAALALTGCSNDDLAASEGINGDTEAHYLSVNIVSTPTMGNRAAGEQMEGNPSGSVYEEGLTHENAVKKVRFYFFDEGGNPANVKRGENKNWFDWENPGDSVNNMPNIEKRLKAVLLIETSKGDKLPSKIVATVNPDAMTDENGQNILGNGSMSLNDWRNAVCDYAAKANTRKDGMFVMTNSTYMLEPSKKIIYATDVTNASYQKSETEATMNPVTIYVERTMVKVRLKSSLPTDLIKTVGDDQLILLKDSTKEHNNYTIGDKQIYAKVLGWNVTGFLPRAYENKHIMATWRTNILGENTVWNYPEYFRCFWAAECIDASNKNNIYLPFRTSNGVTLAADQYSFDPTGKQVNYVYCNENADREKGSTKKHTQVIIPAILCDEFGSPLTITEYAGNKIIDTDDHIGLKNALLETFKASGHNYYRALAKSNEEGKTVYKQISPEDITFQTAAEAGKITLGQDVGAYYVYAKMDKGRTNANGDMIGEAATWFVMNDEGKYVTASLDQINAALKSIESAKIWKTGMTYYYVDIRHFGNGTFGVVRNHIYDINLKNIYGLGTPVYNPNEVIYPEKPQSDNTFIAASIDILSWRVVPNDVTLNW